MYVLSLNFVPTYGFFYLCTSKYEMTVTLCKLYTCTFMYIVHVHVFLEADQAQDGTMEKMKEAIMGYLYGLNYDHIGDRFIAFDNRNRPYDQVINLFHVIEENLLRHNGHPYSHVAFQYAQEVLKEEKESMRAALEFELEFRIEEVTSVIRAEHENLLATIQIELDEKTRAINELSHEARTERRKLQQEISGLQNELVALDKRKKQETERAVQTAVNTVTNDYGHKLRGMEEKFQQQNALLAQSNQAVTALRSQVTQLASRPTTVVRKGGGCFDGLSRVVTPAGIKFMNELKVGYVVYFFLAL